MSPLNITQPLDSIRYMVYNGYYKVMSNIPQMGHLTTPVNTYKYHTCRRTSATTSYIQYLPELLVPQCSNPWMSNPVRNNDPNGNVIKPQAQSHQGIRATVVRAVRFPCLVGRLHVVFRISSTQWMGWFFRTFGSVPPGSLSVRPKVAGVMKVHAPKLMENGRFWPPYHDSEF